MKKLMSELWLSLMDSRHNPLQHLDSAAGHYLMQVLGWMWSMIFCLSFLSIFQFHLILHFFNVQRAAGRQTTSEGATDGCSKLIDQLANTRRGCRRATFYRQKCLGHGNGDFVVGVGNSSAVAFNDLKLARR